MSSPRPRRLLFALLSIPVLFILFLYFSSRTSIFATDVEPPKLPDEIFGLLHFVTSPDEAGRVIYTASDTLEHAQPGGVVAPDKPVEMAWYALGSNAKHARTGRPGTVYSDWDQRVAVLRDEYPLVVFSKSHCPYSKRAKQLLESYNLSPPPKIIEVDLRADAPHIKTILTRLTQRSTFPNAILRGRSLGGSDDLIRLHEQGRLHEELVNNGVSVILA